MSHDLYRDVYLQIRARTCATVAEAKDAADAIITRLFVENQRLRNKTAGTHGTPELDEDARKLEAMGQDPGATLATDPAPAVCEWTDHGPEWISTCKHRFGAFASTKGRFFCPGCGGAIKFTEAAHDKANGVPDEIY